MDIELAKKANYRNRLMPKLEKREAICMELMQNNNNRMRTMTAKLSDADENFPGMANVLEIKGNNEFGRHIVAKCDIPVGRTILIEKKFISSTPKEKYTICHRICMNFITCQHCTNN